LISFLKNQKTEHDISWIELNTSAGNMIIELSPQEQITFQLMSGKQGSLIIPQGIAHVTRLDIKIFIPIQL